jgi:hypothetical protein
VRVVVLVVVVVVLVTVVVVLVTVVATVVVRVVVVVLRLRHVRTSFGVVVDGLDNDKQAFASGPDLACRRAVAGRC